MQLMGGVLEIACLKANSNIEIVAIGATYFSHERIGWTPLRLSITLARYMTILWVSEVL